MIKNQRTITFLSIYAFFASIFYLNLALIDAQGNNYPLLAKRIFLNNPDDILVNFSPLREELRGYFNEIPYKYSFYFEYLFTGTSIRIGENEELVGASLLKVPLAMDLYKAAELERIRLDVPVEIRKEDLDPHFGDLWKKGPGAHITLEKAAKLTLTESDNTAGNLILRSLDGVLSKDEEATREIDMSTSITEDDRSTVTARSYSSIFKCLYVACFISKDYSQKVLGYLSQTKFDSRLVAGLPKDITVSHKIGTFSNKVQSDCGIVFPPRRPYLICVMIGSDSNEADKIIREVSEKVYNYIINQKPNTQ